MGAAIKHPKPDWVKPSFVILTSGHSGARGWASECPDVKNYKWQLNPFWHRMYPAVPKWQHWALCHLARKQIGSILQLLWLAVYNDAVTLARRDSPDSSMWMSSELSISSSMPVILPARSRCMAWISGNSRSPSICFCSWTLTDDSMLAVRGSCSWITQCLKASA